MKRSLRTLIALLLCALLILSAFAGQALAKYVKSVTVTNALSVTITPPATAQEPAIEENAPAETAPTEPDEEAAPADPDADDTADSADPAEEPADPELESDPVETIPEEPAADSEADVPAE